MNSSENPGKPDRTDGRPGRRKPVKPARSVKRATTGSRPASKSKRKSRKPRPVNQYQAPDVEIWLDGTFLEGGAAVVRHGETLVDVPVSQCHFAVLALLMMTAHKDAEADASDADAWVPQGFATTSRLKALIIHWTQETVNAGSLAKHVFRVRQLLERVADSHFITPDPRAWARKLLESGSRGYRLSTPADQLHLKVRPPFPKRRLTDENGI